MAAGSALSLRCAFYDAVTGGEPLYQAIQPVVLGPEGRFAVQIGSGQVLPAREASLSAVFQHHARIWLGLTVNQDAELAPRTAIGSVPRASAGPPAAPSGSIWMWSGSLDEVPAGWRLCDGSAGTPDLRGRFVMGALPDQPAGVLGGQAAVTLPADWLVAHGHSMSMGESGSHVHTCDQPINFPDMASYWLGFIERSIVTHLQEDQPVQQTSWNWGHCHGGETRLAGNAAIETRLPVLPAHCRLAFIQKE